MIQRPRPGAVGPVAVGITGGLLLAQPLGLHLAEDVPTAIATLAILGLGLPHGAFDIELLRARAHGGIRQLAPILGLYLGVAAAAALVWSVAPLAALAGFIVVAVIHFSEDWTGTRSGFLATGIAAASIAAPALLHTADVARIFVALTADPAAALAAKLLAVAAPTALAVALAGIAALIAEHRRADAAAAASSLAALVFLPPVVGFAVFFCLFHSPRHFTAALRALASPRLADWIRVAGPVTLAALAIVAVLYAGHDAGAVPLRLASATFMALSVLTMPHILAPRLVGWIEAQVRGPWSVQRERSVTYLQ